MRLPAWKARTVRVSERQILWGRRRYRNRHERAAPECPNQCHTNMPRAASSLAFTFREKLHHRSRGVAPWGIGARGGSHRASVSRETQLRLPWTSKYSRGQSASDAARALCAFPDAGSHRPGSCSHARRTGSRTSDSRGQPLIQAPLRTPVDGQRVHNRPPYTTAT